jgi:hypothetical protein
VILPNPLYWIMMDYYGIETESEILSDNIMKMSKSFTKRRDADGITIAENVNIMRFWLVSLILIKLSG